MIVHTEMLSLRSWFFGIWNPWFVFTVRTLGIMWFSITPWRYGGSTIDTNVFKLCRVVQLLNGVFARHLAYVHNIFQVQWDEPHKKKTCHPRLSLAPLFRSSLASFSLHNSHSSHKSIISVFFEIELGWCTLSQWELNEIRPHTTVHPSMSVLLW